MLIDTVIVEKRDPDLVAACLRKDRRAQEMLYKKYVTIMYNRVLRMTANRESSEDLVQEIFTKVFRNLHQYRGDSTLDGWIARITVNTTISYLRRRKQLRFEEISENTLSIDPVTPQRDQGDLIKQIHSAILQLPPGCRTVFNLIAVEGLRHREVAALLSISESTSKTQYRRAKQLLREHLDDYTNG